MKKLILCIFGICTFTGLLTIAGCEPNKTNPEQGFNLSNSSVTIGIGQTSKVEINGQSVYSVSSSDESIVAASINQKTITITAKNKAGTAVIKVADTKKTLQPKEIKVTVVDNPEKPSEGAIIENGVLVGWDCNQIPSDGHITIPKPVTKIADKVFLSCPNLISVTFNDDITSIGEEAFANCPNLETVNFSKELTYIGKKAFFFCAKLKEAKLPDNITEIEESTFEFCESMVNVTLPNSLKELGKRAFAGAPITKIVLPATLNKIGVGVFSSCANLTAFEVDAANPNFIAEDGVLFDKAKTRLIQYPKGKTANSIVIPASVKSIDSEAFYYCGNLTSITIPEGITKIEDYTFIGTNITEIKIPESVTEIGELALSQTQITSLSLPANVKKLGPGVFANNEMLTKVVLNDNITAIPVNAFYDCIELSDITMGKNIEDIQDGALYHCTQIKELIIPNKVRKIGKLAFSDCTAIKKIHIPATVTNIEERAFAVIFDAEEVICDAINPPKLGKSVFDRMGEGEDSDRKVKLIVPKGSKRAYMAVEQWRDFEISEK